MKLKKTPVLTIILVLLFAAMLILTACSSGNIVRVRFFVDGRLYKEYKIEVGGSLAEIPEVPERAGYKGKWSVTDFDEIKKDIDVTAIYENAYYTVTFMVDGKVYVSITESTSKNISNYPVAPPEKEGYDAEWSIASFANIRIDTTVTAVYTLKPTYVSFYESAYRYEAADVAVGDPVVAGKYYESANGDYVLTRDSVFARSKKYYVRERELFATVKIDNGQITDVPLPPVSEGRSVKWMTLELTENGERFSEFIPNGLSGNTSVVAYEYITVRLTDGTGASPISSIVEFDVGEKVDSIGAIIDRFDGYDFYGWYLDADFRTQLVFPCVFDRDASLYSRWIRTVATEGLTFLDDKVTGYEGTESVVHIPYRYRNGEGEYVNVTGIAEGAFAENDTVTEIHFAGTLTDIAKNAFRDCTALTDIVFDDGCYIEAVGDYAFAGCTRLTGMTLCEKTIFLGEHAFDGCEGLTAINGMESTALTEIPDAAFLGCGELEMLTVPAGVTAIGASAFENAERLRLVFADEDALRTVGARAFAGCVGFVGLNAKNLEEIGEKAYENCPGMISATFIAGGVGTELFADKGDEERVGYYYVTVDQKAYAVPEYLYTVTFARGNGVVRTGAAANLVTVKSFVLTDGITEIEPEAFKTTKGVNSYEMSVLMPSSLTKIGAEAFAGRTDLRQISLPSSLEEIGDRAFYGLTELNDVSLPQKNSLNVLGREVFSGTRWYNSYSGVIVLGTVVAGISETYCRNHGITEIKASDMGASASVAPYAFYGNEILETVTLGEWIYSVGEYAFAECSGLKSFIFNANMLSAMTRSLGDGILEGCENLEHLTVYEDVDAKKLFGSIPERLTSLGLEFASQSVTVTSDVFEIFGQITELRIGNGFTSIEENALTVCPALQRVKLGSDITTVGKGAFENLSRLTELDLTEADALDVIEENAFAGTALTELILPQSVTSIGKAAFKGASLTAVNLGGKIETVGISAFEDNISLTEVNFGENVNKIGDYAFKNCDLTVLVMPEKVTAENVGKGILALNGNLRSITSSQSLSVANLFTYERDGNDICEISENFSSARVTGGKIGARQYYDIGTLQTVIIEAGVTEIGESAMEKCTAIRTLTLPSTVETIGEKAFAGCVSLITCQIEALNSNLEYVGKEAFKGDASLGYAVFPSTLENGDWTGMFDGCESLTTTNIPDAVKVIGDFAYRNCSSIISVNMHDDIAAIGEEAFKGCLKIDFDDVRFDSLESIGKNAFSGCKAMHGIRATSATQIGESAFVGCSSVIEITVTGNGIGYYTDNTANLLTVNVIGKPAQNAFTGCDSLETLVIMGVNDGDAEDVAQAIKYLDFTKVTVFVEKNIYQTVAAAYSVHVNPTDEGVFKFDFSADGTATLTGVRDIEAMDGTLYIPHTVMNGGRKYTVTAIGQRAFGNQLITENVEIKDKLKSVIIPSSVTEIGLEAFARCYNLTDLKFESGSRLTTIGASAFRYCQSLGNVSFPSSVTTVADRAFENCTRMSFTFYANSKLTSIGEYAFYMVWGLTDVRLTGPITNIGGSAFSGCIHLKSFSFGPKATVTEIAHQTFYGANELEEIEIPSMVRRIGMNAFKNCYLLSSITLPDKLTEIGTSAFESCGIESVTFGGSLTTIEASAFSSCENLVSVVIPDTVTSIGAYAFRRCLSLKYITIGKGVLTVGSGAFEGTKDLLTIRYNAKKVSDVENNANLFFSEDSVIKIELFIGSEVERIPANFFAGSAVKYAPPISRVTFEGVSSCATVGARAFANVVDLREMLLPVSVLSIGADAFLGTSLSLRLEAAKTPAGFADGWDNGLLGRTVFGINNVIYGDYSFVVYSGGAYLTDYLGTDNSVTVPYSINGYTVKDVGAAFEGLSFLTEITVPNGVERIGSYRDSVNLKTVTIEGNISVIPDRAFYNCSSLDNLVIPVGVTEIGEKAFFGCNALETVYIDGAKAALLLNDAVKCGNITDYALSLYIAETAGDVVAEGGYFKLPVTVNGYGIFTKHYWRVGVRGADSPIAYMVKESLRDEYSLTVDGSGDMTDYEAIALVPWHEYIDKIVKVTVESEVGTLGTNAFVALTGLREIRYNAMESVYTENKRLFNGSGSGDGLTVYIGHTVKSVPAYFMDGNTRLTDIEFNGEALREIEHHAFYGCTSLTRVVIPDNVTVMGASAFENATGIVTLTLGTGLKALGSRAFYGNDALQTVNYNVASADSPEGNMYVFSSSNNMGIYDSGFTLNIGASVVKIPDYAFYSCTNLKEIIFPSRSLLTEIGTEAFYKCEFITDLVLPASLVSISERAFAESIRLANIGLSSSTSALTEIGRAAFEGTAFFLDISNWRGDEETVTTRGVLYLGGRYLIKAKTGLSGEYAVEGSTTMIANEAFEGCNALEYLRIPTAVEYIGTDAFAGCDKLKTVYLSSYAVAAGLTEADSFGGLAKNALHVYVAKTLINDRNVRVGQLLRNSFTEINELIEFRAGSYYVYTKASWNTGRVRAFLVNDENRPGFYEINIYGSGEMGNYGTGNYAPWREYLKALSRVTVRNGVENIGSYAFYGGDGIESVTVDSSVKEIGASAFEGCSSVSSLYLTENITKLGNRAFADCVNVKIFTYLARNLEDLGENNGVFENLGTASESGVTVNVDRFVEYIPAYLFYPSDEGTPNITIVDFKSSNNINGVETIAPYAFAYLKNLRTLKLAKGATLKTICDCAFIGCRTLEAIDLTVGIECIGRDAFAEISALKQVTYAALEFTENSEGNTAFRDSGSASENGFTVTVSSRSRVIPPYLFEDAGWLMTLEFEEDGACEEIGAGAFEDCMKLETVIVPDFVNVIGEGAFSGCIALRSITVPFVGNRAEEVEATPTGTFGFIFGRKEKAGATETNQEHGSGTAKYYLPDSLKTVTVTKYINLYYGAFMNCQYIERVILNANTDVDTVYKYELNEFGKEIITASVINGGRVEGEAFENCVSLKTVSLSPALMTIDRNAFFSCINLTEITISENVTAIGDGAFRECRSLTKIYFNAVSCMESEDEKTRARNMFSGVGYDKAGTEVVFGAKVRRVPSYLFNVTGTLEPVKLSKITFAEGSVCTEIGESAFHGAGANTLTEISLPTTLTSVGKDVFVGTAYYRNILNWQNNVLYIGNCLIEANYRNDINTLSYTVVNGTDLIANNAFRACIYLATVKLPASVKYIGDYAFAGCSKLQTLDTEIASELTYIGSYAFSNCVELGTGENESGEPSGIYIRQKVSYIGDYAFNGCDGLTRVFIDSATVAKDVNGRAFMGAYAYGGLICNAEAVFISTDVPQTSSYVVNNSDGGMTLNGYKRYLLNK